MIGTAQIKSIKMQILRVIHEMHKKDKSSNDYSSDYIAKTCFITVLMSSGNNPSRLQFTKCSKCVCISYLVSGL